MKINCDLGEGLDDADSALIPLVDQASIACGAHAGDSATVTRCILLAKEHNTEIGIHPSYPDRANFGRVTMDMNVNQLAQSLQEQIDLFLGICYANQTKAHYVKPHGALYNDIVKRPQLLHLLMRLVSKLNERHRVSPVALMISANLRTPDLLAQAQAVNLPLIFEGFADRAYTDRGELVSRTQTHAVHQSSEKIIRQINDFTNKGGVYSENNTWMPMEVDTLCIHGDNPLAIDVLKKTSGKLQRV